MYINSKLYTNTLFQTLVLSQLLCLEVFLEPNDIRQEKAFIQNVEENAQ